MVDNLGDVDVGADADLPDGHMQEVEIGGRKILLAKAGERWHAVDAICPHAGGPLAEGVLRGNVVVCPWHKAAFNVDTGRRVEPPAMDDLAKLGVRIADGRIMVGAQEKRDALVVDSEHDQRRMVIIGAGAAGAVAAQTLREAGFSGQVVMVSPEPQLPYDRTILSKYVLSGQEGGEKMPLQNDAFYHRHQIARLVRHVTEVDTGARQLRFSDGTLMPYDAVLIATGGVPKPATIPGADLAGVFLLRSAADAAAIVAASGLARKAVVIGAGFIGIEAAGSLRERGLDVTVVAPQNAPFEKQLGAEIGNVFRRLHEQKGVVFHLGDDVVAVEGNMHVQRVRLKSGGVLDADIVIVGAGITPSTEIVSNWAQKANRAVAVDRHLLVTDGVYAAGDIAEFPLRGDGKKVRVEHWRVAQQHGRVAALNMLGQSVAYDAVPYFWTIHYMKRLDYVGHAEEWDEIVIDGDLEPPNFLAFYVLNAEVKAVAGWDRDRQMAAALVLMNERSQWSVDELRREITTF